MTVDSRFGDFKIVVIGKASFCDSVLYFAIMEIRQKLKLKSDFQYFIEL